MKWGSGKIPHTKPENWQETCHLSRSLLWEINLLREVETLSQKHIRVSGSCIKCMVQEFKAKKLAHKRILRPQQKQMQHPSIDIPVVHSVGTPDSLLKMHSQ